MWFSFNGKTYNAETFGLTEEQAQQFFGMTDAEKVNVMASIWRLHGLNAEQAQDCAQRMETPVQWATRRVREDREAGRAARYPKGVPRSALRKP